ncbi:MAG: hypothetical protein KatS3mg029_0777 [Saprospiraceae bacterium]|nr:MAG: hypothetical protein KatS3mg029_0777 [Saprospiraceae bacterium]
MQQSLPRRPPLSPLLHAHPPQGLGLVVVIPCHDEPALIDSLTTLRNCDPPQCDVEVIIVINDGEDATPEVVARNRQTLQEVRHWIAGHALPWLHFHVIYQSGLPRKHAGVGLARKIGMDEACLRLEEVGKPEGIIACFDADTLCQPNYFRALVTHFRNHPKCQACSIRFEHPLSGNSFAPSVYEAIAAYELHLRYFIDAQRWAGHPHALHTIGSAMAVRADAYRKQGGMNKRQAGEDFYFLHKFTPLGSVMELNATTVIPSPRPSHRVPFGTGKAVSDLTQGRKIAKTYNPESFRMLKLFFEKIRELPPTPPPHLPSTLSGFLELVHFEQKWQELKKHTATEASFRQRFFRWFNAFMVMKFLHHSRQDGYPDVPVVEAAAWLLDAVGQPTSEVDIRSLLLAFRRLDLLGIFPLPTA